MQCDTAPLSSSGIINVTWFYVHTGGLDLSHISLLYGISGQYPQFQPLSEIQAPAGVLEDYLTGYTVQELPAGNNYTFQIVSSNAMGNSSTICPPVTHSIGKLRRVLIKRVILC